MSEMGLNVYWSVPPPFPVHPSQLKYSSYILTIVPQLVDILMLVADYFSDSTCSGSNRKGDIHSNNDIEIWIALLNSTDKNHIHFDVSPSDIIHLQNNALQANVHNSYASSITNTSPNSTNLHFFEKKDTCCI